jgi:hypothetical protein
MLSFQNTVEYFFVNKCKRQRMGSFDYQKGDQLWIHIFRKVYRNKIIEIYVQKMKCRTDLLRQNCQVISSFFTQ